MVSLQVQPRMLSQEYHCLVQRIQLVPHQCFPLVVVVVKVDLAGMIHLHLMEVEDLAADLLLHLHTVAGEDLEDQVVVVMAMIVVVVVVVEVDEDLAEEAVEEEEEAVTILTQLAHLLLRQSQ